MWYDQDIPELEKKLNTAVVEFLYSELSLTTLEQRARSLTEDGLIYHYRSCSCSPDDRFDVLEPPAGSVCSWSVLLSLLTGDYDPRSELGKFEAFEFRCHSPIVFSWVNAELQLFRAFTKATKVYSWTK